MVVGVALFLCAGAPAWGGEFSEPGNTFGVANCFGQVQFCGHLGTVRFSAVEEVPLRYIFCSDRGFDSPHLGRLFSVPLLESTLIDHDWYLERTTLGGATQYLYRLPQAPAEYESMNCRHRARRLGQDAFAVTTGDGYALEYRAGRMERFRTPSGAVVTARYEQGQCRGLQSVSAGAAVSFWDRGGHRELTTHRGGYRIVLQPHIGPAPERLATLENALEGSAIKDRLPTPAPAGPPRTLATIGWPDGRETTFRFSRDPGRDQMRMEMEYGGRKVAYLWGLSGDRIVEAGGIRYEVAPLTRESGVDGEHLEAGVYEIARRFPDGTSHSLREDEDKGWIEEEGRDGTVLRTHRITARGPTYNRVKKIERRSRGESRWKLGDWKTIYEAFYDIRGRLIRDVREGVVTYHLHPGMRLPEGVMKPGDDARQYDEAGRVILELVGGERRAVTHLPGGGRKVTVTRPSGESETAVYDARGERIGAAPAGGGS